MISFLDPDLCKKMNQHQNIFQGSLKTPLSDEIDFLPIAHVSYNGF